MGQKEGIGNMKNFKLGLKQIKHIVSKFIMRVKNQNGTPHLEAPEDGRTPNRDPEN